MTWPLLLTNLSARPIIRKKFLRAEEIRPVQLPPKVIDHFEFVRTVLKDKHYIETGWPWYSMAPILTRELTPHIVKIVHIVRHPVRVALSPTSHRVYDSDHPYFSEAAIDPFDPGVVQKHLGKAWDSMTKYEKCIFWWTEINLYAEEIKRTYSPEVLLIRFENLFATEGTALTSLSKFMSFDYMPSIEDARKIRIDNFRRHIWPANWRRILKYQETVDLSKKMATVLRKQIFQIFVSVIFIYLRNG